MKKPSEGKKGLPEYMGTYGDMITLMLCFFVMLFAMSSIDVEKFRAMAESFSGKPVVIQGSMGNIISDDSIGFLPEFNALESVEMENEDDKKAAAEAREKYEKLESMATFFKTYLASDTATSEFDIEVAGEYVKIIFPDGVLFDSGRADLKSGAIAAIDIVAEAILSEYSSNMVRVEGHTDSIPINTVQFPSNRHLSSSRASTVVEYLVNLKGFNPMLVRSEGMSEYHPADTNSTPEGRAKNRRVEIKVYAEGSEAAAEGFTLIMD